MNDIIMPQIETKTRTIHRMGGYPRPASQLKTQERDIFCGKYRISIRQSTNELEGVLNILWGTQYLEMDNGGGPAKYSRTRHYDVSHVLYMAMF